MATYNSYWCRLNACFEVTSTHTTSILYFVKKIYTKNLLYITVFTDIETQQNYQVFNMFTNMAITGIHCKPCATMVSNLHRSFILRYNRHWCPMKTLYHYLPQISDLVSWWSLVSTTDSLTFCYDGHLCPVQIPYLGPWWSLLSTANLYLVPLEPLEYAL
jgi:hypothetical protein